MCTVLLSPGDNLSAVNKYIYLSIRVRNNAGKDNKAHLY